MYARNSKSSITTGLNDVLCSAVRRDHISYGTRKHSSRPRRDLSRHSLRVHCGRSDYLLPALDLAFHESTEPLLPAVRPIGNFGGVVD